MNHAGKTGSIRKGRSYERLKDTSNWKFSVWWFRALQCLWGWRTVIMGGDYFHQPGRKSCGLELAFFLSLFARHFSKHTYFLSLPACCWTFFLNGRNHVICFRCDSDYYNTVFQGPPMHCTPRLPSFNLWVISHRAHLIYLSLDNVHLGQSHCLVFEECHCRHLWAALIVACFCQCLLCRSDECHTSGQSAVSLWSWFIFPWCLWYCTTLACASGTFLCFLGEIFILICCPVLRGFLFIIG